jgi:hypothetical protein
MRAGHAKPVVPLCPPDCLARWKRREDREDALSSVSDSHLGMRDTGHYFDRFRRTCFRHMDSTRRGPDGSFQARTWFPERCVAALKPKL